MKNKQSPKSSFANSRFTGTGLYACEWEFLKGCTLAVSDLFWKKSDGRLYRVAQKGDYLDHKKCKRFYDKNHSLYSAINQKDHQEKLLEAKLDDFVKADYEGQRLLARQELIKCLYQFYFSEDSQAEIFDLVHVFDRQFNLLSPDHQDFLLRYPNENRLASLRGTLNAIGGLLLGYNSELYLQDLYTIAFFYQASLYAGRSLNIATALTLELKSPGDFKSCIEKLSKNEKQIIFRHPESDYRFLKDNYPNLLHHSSSYQLVRRTREKISARGYPYNLCQEEISDIELWILMISHCFNASDFRYHHADGSRFLSKLKAGEFCSEEIQEVLGRRIKYFFDSAFPKENDVNEEAS